ncbi:MAG: hypothetical protein WA960_07365 [Tunicatimonas sp.]
MLQKILLFIVLPLGVLAGLGYYWLGGFNEIKVAVVKEPVRPLVGKAYRGQYGDLALRKIFVQAQRLLASDSVVGTLLVVNLDSASAGGKQVNQFIGIALTAPVNPLPAGYQQDSLAAGTYLRAQVAAHSLVQPHPSSINERLLDYAAEHQLTLSGLPIEIYRAPDTLWVEMAVCTP